MARLRDTFLATAALVLVAAAPASATFPGENGRIAFDTNRADAADVFTMTATGSGLFNVTRGGGFNDSPAWSPDGRRIAFRTIGGGQEDIYVMNANGTGLVNVTNSPGVGEGSPAWSPDGSKIAFERIVGSGINFEIFVQSVSGGPAVNISNSPDIDGGADWSPDGTKIAFFSGRDGPNNDEIYVMDADGTDQTRLTMTAANTFDDSPSWAPDGSRIVFNRRTFGSFADVWSMLPNGLDQEKLTESAATDVTPSWSPDGTRIAFMSTRDGNSEIYTMTAVGSDETRITTNSGTDERPAWGVPTPPFPPPPPPPPPPGVGDPDLAGLSRVVRVGRTGRGVARARCDNLATDSCRVALTLRVRRVRVGTIRGLIDGGERGRLTLKLNKKGRKMLRRSARKRLGVRARGTSANRLGERTAVSARLTVKPKRRRR